MRKLLILACLLFVFDATAQINYYNHFTDGRLRIDFILSGDYYCQNAALADIHAEGDWSGTKNNLIDPFNYGKYLLKVYDSDTLVFSTGFCSLFEEWCTTDEAKIRKRGYSHSVRIPEPKNTVSVELLQRSWHTGEFDTVLVRFDIDPTDKLLVKRDKENNFEAIPVILNKDSSEAVDIVFVAEGYKDDEMIKFSDDAKRFAEYLFEVEPFKSHQEDFNVWMVHTPSIDSGVDIPHEDIWRQTIADSHFYSLYVDRYLTIPDQTKIAKLTANAPCDVIYVIANTNIYGGGGIYNSYSVCAADSYSDAEVFVHEFGHSFAGLGDEYYEKGVTFNEYLNLDIEPWEPNFTTLVDFDSKWKDMVSEDIPIPTPNEIDYADALGVFEGASYTAKGAYRPVYNCRMKQNDADGFCPVCQRAIVRMIDYYCR